MNITTTTTVLPAAKINADYVSDNDIIPEDLQNRLQYWRDTFCVGQFDIGDITAEIIGNIALGGKSIPEARVFQAVGHFCGKSGRTIRYYYETAIFYPWATRQEYDTLPFSHFVVARKLDRHPSRWVDVLEHSMLHPGMSAEALERFFRADGITKSPNAKLHQFSEDDLPTRYGDDEIADDDDDGTWNGVVRDLSQDSEEGKAYGAISNLNACVYALGEVVKAMPAIDLKFLSDERKDALVATMNSLRRDLTTIMQELAQKAS